MSTRRRCPVRVRVWPIHYPLPSLQPKKPQLLLTPKIRGLIFVYIVIFYLGIHLGLVVYYKTILIILATITIHRLCRSRWSCRAAIPSRLFRSTLASSDIVGDRFAGIDPVGVDVDGV
jgi:hypothetical protein